MKPYDPDARCPKCNGGMVTSTWDVKGDEESMKRVCTRCKFSWSERPIDQLTEEERAVLEEKMGETLED